MSTAAAMEFCFPQQFYHVITPNIIPPHHRQELLGDTQVVDHCIQHMQQQHRVARHDMRLFVSAAWAARYARHNYYQDVAVQPTALPILLVTSRLHSATHLPFLVVVGEQQYSSAGNN